MNTSNDFIKALLFPFSLLYGMITSFRNGLFNWRILPVEEFNIPIISIGNITVGGTGKTPHTEYLVNLLKDKYPLAILSRGYKRKTRGFVLADGKSTDKTIGDEPFQMKFKFNDITVAVDENRRRGIKNLIHLEPAQRPEIILLDDGYQHRYVKPGLSILLTDYNHLFVHDKMLPLGNLREGQHNKNRADIVIVTKCPKDIRPIDYLIIKKDLNLVVYQELYFSNFRYEDLNPIFPDFVPEPVKIENLRTNDSAILVITGIVSPEQLYEHLEEYTKNISTLSYADHHAFTRKEIASINAKFEKINATNKVIVVTEKDAARLINLPLPESLKKSIYSIGINVEILQEKQDDFKLKILNYVKRNN
jgi:tetraacyldisaccharide 4'-kinase